MLLERGQRLKESVMLSLKSDSASLSVAPGTDEPSADTESQPSHNLHLLPEHSRTFQDEVRLSSASSDVARSEDLPAVLCGTECTPALLRLYGYDEARLRRPSPLRQFHDITSATSCRSSLTTCSGSETMGDPTMSSFADLPDTCTPANVPIPGVSGNNNRPIHDLARPPHARGVDAFDESEYANLSAFIDRQRSADSSYVAPELRPSFSPVSLASRMLSDSSHDEISLLLAELQPKSRESFYSDYALPGVNHLLPIADESTYLAPRGNSRVNYVDDKTGLQSRPGVLSGSESDDFKLSAKSDLLSNYDIGKGDDSFAGESGLTISSFSGDLSPRSLSDGFIDSSLGKAAKSHGNNSELDISPLSLSSGGNLTSLNPSLSAIKVATGLELFDESISSDILLADAYKSTFDCTDFTSITGFDDRHDGPSCERNPHASLTRREQKTLSCSAHQSSVGKIATAEVEPLGSTQEMPFDLEQALRDDNAQTSSSSSTISSFNFDASTTSELFSDSDGWLSRLCRDHSIIGRSAIAQLAHMSGKPGQRREMPLDSLDVSTATAASTTVDYASPVQQHESEPIAADFDNDHRENICEVTSYEPGLNDGKRSTGNNPGVALDSGMFSGTNWCSQEPNALSNLGVNQGMVSFK